MKADLVRMIDVFLDGASQPLIVVVGPTASGKTSLSLEIAMHVDGEIVNADSRQLYISLTIGTAKITEGEMHGIPHHLLSLYDPKEEVTAGKFQEQATSVIRDIHVRRKVPILVGGSMLYVASITDGLILGPPSDRVMRERLEREYEEDGGKRLYHRLQRIDIDAAVGIHPGNRAAVIRAVEMYELTKMPKSVAISQNAGLLQLSSSLRQDCGRQARLRPAGMITHHEQKKCSYDLLILGLSIGREELKKCIRRKVDAMIEQGWIDEVRDLLARGYTPSDPGMESHGYREICEFLEELEAGEVGEEIEEAKKRLKQRITTKTCQYAKRQMTWWRNDPRIHWIS